MATVDKQALYQALLALEDEVPCSDEDQERLIGGILSEQRARRRRTWRRMVLGGGSLLVAACLLLIVFWPWGGRVPDYSLYIQSDAGVYATPNAQPQDPQPARLTNRSMLRVELRPSERVTGVHVFAYVIDPAGLRPLRTGEIVPSSLGTVRIAVQVEESGLRLGKQQVAFAIGRGSGAPRPDDILDVIQHSPSGRPTERSGWQILWKAVVVQDEGARP